MGDENAPDAKTGSESLAARVARRFFEKHGAMPLDRALAALPANDLTTLLLETLRDRARRRSWKEVMERAADAEVFHASTVDGRASAALTRALYAAAEGFDAVELAPIQPAGTSSCASVDPNNVLGTVRFAEVAADAATGLALHAARARVGGNAESLRFCATQRVLRMQPITQAGFSPHFRLDALGSAARSSRKGADRSIENRLLLDQLRVWSTLVRMLRDDGRRVASVRFVVSDTRVVRACVRARGGDPLALARGAVAHRPGSTDAVLAEAGIDLPRSMEDLAATARSIDAGTDAIEAATQLAEEVASPARAEGMTVAFDPARLQGLGYYDGPFLQIWMRRDDGLEVPIGEGGALPWLGNMLSDRRQRLVVTGVGGEGMLKLFF